MANDRIYIRCKGCKKEQILAKYWGSRLSSYFDADTLAAFLEEHGPCNANFGNFTLWGEPGFVFATESRVRKLRPIKAIYSILVSPDKAQAHMVSRRVENSRGMTVHEAEFVTQAKADAGIAIGWQLAEVALRHTGKEPWDASDGEAVRQALTGGT